MKLAPMLYLTAIATLTVACKEGHEHSHTHSHSHSHGEDGHTHTHSHGEGEHTHSHTHGPVVKVGPNGGRVLDNVDPNLEFLVNSDLTVTVSALSKDLDSVIPLEEQTIKVTGGDRTNPTQLIFEKAGHAIKSTNKLPDEDDLPIVIQVKTTPDAPNSVVKFNLKPQN